MKKILLLTPLVAASGVSLAQPHFKSNQDQHPTNYVELSSINTKGDAYAIVAPVNGEIIKILVTVGQSVKTGDVLIVMEGLKVETEITAPIDGKVRYIKTSVGKTVEAGTNLMGINN